MLDVLIGDISYLQPVDGSAYDGVGWEMLGE